MRQRNRSIRAMRKQLIRIIHLGSHGIIVAGAQFGRCY
jgi:hypothetical protein